MGIMNNETGTLTRGDSDRLGNGKTENEGGERKTPGDTREN